MLYAELYLVALDFGGQSLVPLVMFLSVLKFTEAVIISGPDRDILHYFILKPTVSKQYKTRGTKDWPPKSSTTE